MKFITIFDPKTELNFVGWMPSAIKVGGVIVAVAVLGMVVRGFPWGLDFTGGTEMQVKFEQPVQAGDVREVLVKAGFAKNQVQQYGSVADDEMLIRVERFTSLTDESITKIKSVLKANHDLLAAGSDKKPEDVTVSFRPEEGDKVTIRLPEPAIAGSGGAGLNSDPATIEAKLKEEQARLEKVKAELGPDAADKPTTLLSETLLDTMAEQGFSRAAVAKKAGELGWTIEAEGEALADPAVDPIVLKDKALKKQRAALAEILDKESGAKLRRSRATDEEEATYEDAIISERPYEGLVKYTVHFRGVGVDIEKALTDRFGKSEIRRVDFVDATVAKQLQTDGLLAVLYALFFILVYVAVRFDFFFSPGAVLALVHDAVGATILFSWVGLEFELPSVAALLTVIGYSINNTIVIYDRIRETVPTDNKKPLSDLEVNKYVNKAVNDTFSRTINTSLTTLFASTALAVFAGGVVQNFALVLSMGIVLGAFSSTFLAPFSYLFFRKNFRQEQGPAQKRRGMSKEDKARGVV